MLIGSVNRFLTSNYDTGSAPPSYDLLNGLAGHWKLDFNLNDSLGANNATSLAWGGGGWDAPPKLGTGMLLCNSTLISLGSSATVKPTTGLSVSGWFKFLISLNDGARFAGDWHQTASEDRWLFYNDHNVNGMKVFFYADGAQRDVAFFPPGSYYTSITGQWLYLTATWSSGDFLKTYVNGALVNTSLATYTTMNTGTAGKNVCLGNQLEANAPYYGYIDDFGIWNRALTPAEVAYLYNAGVGITYPF